MIALVCGAGALIISGQLESTSILYPIYIFVSLILGAIGGTTLAWMLHAWWSPESFSNSRLHHEDLEPSHSFSLIVPARHEETVLERTLERLVASEHPAVQIIVVVGDDDPGTHAAAQRVVDRYPDLVSIVVDTSVPKNKPKALNAALPHCQGTITGVFDAEDSVHPSLLSRVDQCFQKTHADIVQAGVQLMNFRSSWLTVRNVLEYYFWFRSRLHLHARQKFIPLGGNTVFVRTEVLVAVAGWDTECLAEDCELGVRLSALGAHTAVFYEPELVTREECPPTLDAFVRQRTRWNQGYLQTLAKGYWKRLPRKQQMLGAYILAMPYALALAWLLLPISIATAVLVKAPVLVSLVSFLPALPMISVLVVEVAGLGEFCKAYGERPSARDYARLILGLPVYQAVLAFAAARAVIREMTGARGWEKTAHLGLHLDELATSPEPDLAGPRRAPRTRHREPAMDIGGRRFVLGETRSSLPFMASARALALQSGPRHTASARAKALLAEPFPGRRNGRAPLWTRLDSLPLNPAPALPRPGLGPLDPTDAVMRWLRAGGELLRRATSQRTDLVVQVALLALVVTVVATNALHWPGVQFDEGTYVGNAWAVAHGKLAPYTYSYGHPPLAWLLISLWAWLNGLFGQVTYSIDLAREFMVVVDLVSCSLLYTLARRLGFGRVAASAAVILFALSPVGVFFHRAVLLDNPAMAWALAAFVLARTPSRRLWAFAASGVCFALCVLCKETFLVLFPALVLAAAQNTDPRTRRYCGTLFISFFTVVALSYPLYATLKGELLPGPGHVSLVGYAVVQLVTRKGTGSLFDASSQTHAIVAQWLHLDPWLLLVALVLAPLALAWRRTRAVAVAYLIQVLVILKPGYLPNMYVIQLLPFAALIVAGTTEALYRAMSTMRDRATALLTAAYLTVPVLLMLVAVISRWGPTDAAAMSVRQDSLNRRADRWIVDNIGHNQRLIVGDEFYIYLIQHGFNHQPVRGGFFSTTVVSYWPLDYDPAVKRRFRRGWRDFNYIVSTEAMRDSEALTPTATAAIKHSRLIATWGQGIHQIQIRKIVSAPG